MTKPFPIGRQDFEEIIQLGFKYVDKTERMYEMIQDRKMVFLSRPRRFGKTLLVDTLCSYFEGKKDLFRDLKISELEKNWIQYPVIRLDMSAVKDFKLEDLERCICNMILVKYERKYNIIPQEQALAGERFSNIIKTAYQQTGQKVVILIDEYDSVLLGHLHDGQLKEYKRILQSIYQQLKVNEKIEQFVFFTGISRFSQVSIFSTLNNLENISMDDRFSDICGFSKEEVVDYFSDDIKLLAEKFNCDFGTMLQKLKFMYDGYHFSENSKDIFNPISILTCLKNKKMKNYWFETGTPSYVIDHLKHFDANILDFESINLYETGFYVSQEDFNSIYPLLYQAGYLTIKDYDEESDTYTLSYPNNEVRVSMMEALMPSWVGYSPDTSKIKMKDFYFAIKKGDFDQGFEVLKDFFYQIPNILNNKEERHFQTIIYVLFTWLGFYTKVEVNTARGRIDVVLFSDSYIFLIEFKVDQSAQIALDQINQMNYASKYLSDGRRIIKVGVNMSSKERTIDEWKIEG